MLKEVGVRRELEVSRWESGQVSRCVALALSPAHPVAKVTKFSAHFARLGASKCALDYTFQFA